MGAALTGAALGALVEDLALAGPRHPDFVRRHVMWLLKYGLAEPANGFPDPGFRSRAGS